MNRFPQAAYVAFGRHSKVTFVFAIELRCVFVAHSKSGFGCVPVFVQHESTSFLGMTNAASGLKGRLRKFDNTISGKRGHGGADRVRFKHRDYDKLVENRYVAVAPFDQGGPGQVPSHGATDEF